MYEISDSKTQRTDVKEQQPLNHEAATLLTTPQVQVAVTNDTSLSTLPSGAMLLAQLQDCRGLSAEAEVACRQQNEQTMGNGFSRAQDPREYQKAGQDWANGYQRQYGDPAKNLDCAYNPSHPGCQAPGTTPRPAESSSKKSSIPN